MVATVRAIYTEEILNERRKQNAVCRCDVPTEPKEGCPPRCYRCAGIVERRIAERRKMTHEKSMGELVDSINSRQARRRSGYNRRGKK